MKENNTSNYPRTHHRHNQRDKDNDLQLKNHNFGPTHQYLSPQTNESKLPTINLMLCCFHQSKPNMHLINSKNSNHISSNPLLAFRTFQTFSNDLNEKVKVLTMNSAGTDLEVPQPWSCCSVHDEVSESESPTSGAAGCLFDLEYYSETTAKDGHVVEREIEKDFQLRKWV